MVFEKDQVEEGAILRIDVDGKFDGYARLLEPSGSYFTEMISDKTIVIVSRRWLVEFVDISELDFNLSNKDKITQINQKKRKTHRNIKFVGGDFETAQAQFGWLDEEPRQEKEILLDDFNGLF